MSGRLCISILENVAKPNLFLFFLVNTTCSFLPPFPHSYNTNKNGVKKVKFEKNGLILIKAEEEAKHSDDLSFITSDMKLTGGFGFFVAVVLTPDFRALHLVGRVSTT
jgi:hypothetical protein